MDVRLSVEQRALRESAAQLVSSLAPRTVRELDDSERAAKLDAAVAVSGWRELRAAAAGPGGAPLASAVEAALIAEELGRGLADTSFLGPILASELRRLAAAPQGNVPETVAFTPDLSAPARSADGALPAPTVAVDARGSSSALVLVPVPGGYALAEAAIMGANATVDLTRPVARAGPAPVAPLPGQKRLVMTGDLMQWTSLGLAMACADLVGAMDGAVRLARDYAITRRQYGVAIGSFQAVQHRLADAYVALEGSRSIALHAAWAVDAAPPEDALAAAASAKAYCARAARSVCEAAIQVHGGIGNTWECLAHLYLRRALLSCDILGGVGVSLARVLDHHGMGSRNGLR
jgi:alkylation response protein AidB-like acyl-CoA dehydrogenase